MAKKVIDIKDINYNTKHKVEFDEEDIGGLDAEQLLNVLEGSETVVVDLAEDNKHVEVHLDTDVVNKVENSLQKPITPPLADALVGIGINGAQKNIGVGEGLQIVNNVISATGGSSVHKYAHFIRFNLSTNPGGAFYGLVISEKSDSYNVTSLVSFLSDNGYVSDINTFRTIFGVNSLAISGPNTNVIRVPEGIFTQYNRIDVRAIDKTFTIVDGNIVITNSSPTLNGATISSDIVVQLS